MENNSILQKLDGLEARFEEVSGINLDYRPRCDC